MDEGERYNQWLTEDWPILERLERPKVHWNEIELALEREQKRPRGYPLWAVNVYWLLNERGSLRAPEETRNSARGLMVLADVARRDVTPQEVAA